MAREDARWIFEVQPFRILGQDDSTIGWLGENTGRDTRWIKMDLDGEYRIGALAIRSGIPFWVDSQHPYYNVFRRPHRIEVTYSDGTHEEIILADSPNEYQTMELNSTPTTSIRLEIMDTYAGLWGGDDYFAVGRVIPQSVRRVTSSGEESIQDIDLRTTFDSPVSWPLSGPLSDPVLSFIVQEENIGTEEVSQMPTGGETTQVGKDEEESRLPGLVVPGVICSIGLIVLSIVLARRLYRAQKLKQSQTYRQ